MQTIDVFERSLELYKASVWRRGAAVLYIALSIPRFSLANSGMDTSVCLIGNSSSLHVEVGIGAAISRVQ